MHARSPSAVELEQWRFVGLAAACRDKDSRTAVFGALHKLSHPYIAHTVRM
jgi:hypothetical protein